MNYADLKVAILKVKAAVESKDPIAAFQAVAECVKLAGDFFGVQTFAACPPDCHADLMACCDDLKVACDKECAVPKLGGGLWASLILQIVELVVNNIGKK